MNTYEKELFFTLCNFVNRDTDKLNLLLTENASEEVLGTLFFNRMQGIAYTVIRDSGLLGKVNREFRGSLKNAHEHNIEKNLTYFACIRLLSEILRDQKGKYVMLKGALLCNKYPDGCRTSNDIDLLVCPEFVTDIGNTLINAGFMQGNIRNGEFIPATRKEIIESKITRGETVPYILYVGLPFMDYLEVDINFSLDYKNSNDNTVNNIISNATETETEDYGVITPNHIDFLIHLCCHLYKEATTIPWVQMKRDMTLYKYVDIHMLANNMDNNSISNFFNRSKDLNAEEICACVIIWTDGLFGISNRHLVDEANATLSNRDILDIVVAPSEHKTFIYKEKDIKARFFEKNRIDLLKEVIS